jgi:hypothetical protein
MEPAGKSAGSIGMIAISFRRHHRLFLPMVPKTKIAAGSSIIPYSS